MLNRTPEPTLSRRSRWESNRIARALRGMGPVGIAFMLVVVVVAGLYGPRIAGPLVLLWVLIARVPWRDLGFIRPKSWALTIAIGILGGIASKLFMKSIVMPMLGAPDRNSNFDYLVGNTGALPTMMLYLIVGAGFAEELIARGFMFERLGRLIGRSRNALIATVLITSTLFGLAHLPEQQWVGAVNAFIVSVIVGTVFAVYRNLWTVIIWHAAFDICALLILYFDIDTKIANAFFP